MIQIEPGTMAGSEEGRFPLGVYNEKALAG